MNPMRTNTRISTLLTALALATLISAPALADVAEGDFEQGGASWSTSAPTGMSVSFPTTGGNPGGYALLESLLPNPGGVACITQTFTCGDPDGGTECTIGFEYKLDGDGAPGSGRIVVTIDGVSNVVTDTPTGGAWEFVSYVVPCGEHVIEICLEVDPQDNRWSACVDNVRAECTGVVPNDEVSWSSVKARYQ
jgi:hypothetical protein